MATPSAEDLSSSLLSAVVQTFSKRPDIGAYFIEVRPNTKTVVMTAAYTPRPLIVNAGPPDVTIGRTGGRKKTKLWCGPVMSADKLCVYDVETEHKFGEMAMAVVRTLNAEELSHYIEQTGVLVSDSIALFLNAASTWSPSLDDYNREMMQINTDWKSRNLNTWDDFGGGALRMREIARLKELEEREKIRMEQYEANPDFGSF